MTTPFMRGEGPTPRPTFWQRLKRAIILRFARRWIVEGFDPDDYEGEELTFGMFFEPRGRARR